MLSRRAGIGFEIALRARKEGGSPPVVGMELRAIRDTFERTGVIFIEANGGSSGVCLREPKA